MVGASGYVHIVCGRQKTWQMDVKMNCSCETLSFLDEDTLTTSGTGEQHYLPLNLIALRFYLHSTPMCVSPPTVIILNIVLQSTTLNRTSCCFSLLFMTLLFLPHVIDRCKYLHLGSKAYSALSQQVSVCASVY